MGYFVLFLANFFAKYWTKRLERSPDCADAVVLAILGPPVFETPRPTRLVAM
jgi:hypothetical protein